MKVNFGILHILGKDKKNSTQDLVYIYGSRSPIHRNIINPVTPFFLLSQWNTMLCRTTNVYPNNNEISKFHTIEHMLTKIIFITDGMTNYTLILFL